MSITYLDSNDSLSRDVKETLEKALHDTNNPEKLAGHANKMLIIMLDDTQGYYDFGFINSQLQMTECLSLIEACKVLVLEEMGIVNT